MSYTAINGTITNYLNFKIMGNVRNEQETLQKEVKEILEKDVKARGNVRQLIWRFLESHNLLNERIGDIYANWHEYNLPCSNFDSVRRAANEVKKQYPHLQPPEPIKERNLEKQAEYHAAFSKRPTFAYSTMTGTQISFDFAD